MTNFSRLASVSAVLFALISFNVCATEIGGVYFDDLQKVGGTELHLNGSGLRSLLVFKIYAVGLYLPEKKTIAEEVLSLSGPKQLHIVTLRELTAEQIADGLLNAIEKNDTESERALLKPHIDEFRAMLLSLNIAPKGTIMTIDYLPETGTRFLYNGQIKGKDIAGENFYRALLKIWLGPHPIQHSLKDALLGKPQ